MAFTSPAPALQDTADLKAKKCAANPTTFPPSPPTSLSSSVDDKGTDMNVPWNHEDQNEKTSHSELEHNSYFPFSSFNDPSFMGSLSSYELSDFNFEMPKDGLLNPPSPIPTTITPEFNLFEPSEQKYLTDFLDTFTYDQSLSAQLQDESSLEPTLSLPEPPSHDFNLGGLSLLDPFSMSTLHDLPDHASFLKRHREPSYLTPMSSTPYQDLLSNLSYSRDLRLDIHNDLSALNSQNFTKSPLKRKSMLPLEPFSSKRTHSDPSLTMTSKQSQVHESSSKSRGASKESSSGTKPRKELLTEEEKRANHIASEQKRRNMIRAGFRDLSDIVPTLRNLNNSKSTILFKTADFIRHLQSKNMKYQQKIELLKKEFELKCHSSLLPSSLMNSSSHLSIHHQNATAYHPFTFSTHHSL